MVKNEISLNIMRVGSKSSQCSHEHFYIVYIIFYWWYIYISHIEKFLTFN